jgi:heat shock protein HtpX
LLRKLDLAELTGVLAHELAHIRNNDLQLMAFADLMSRVMQVMSWTGLLLALWQLPGLWTGDSRVPWLGIALLYLGPALTNLLQLALSRSREFDADLDAVTYTGDPEALASALAKIEHYQGRTIEDLVFPSSRRVPAPSILRTHPATASRLERLRQVARHVGQRPRIALADSSEFMVSMGGAGPASLKPATGCPASGSECAARHRA